MFVMFRRESGAVGLEYAGIVLIAAMLVGALTFAVTTDTRLGRTVSAAVCEITSLGDGDCSSATVAAQPEADRRPDGPCVLSSTGHEAQLSVSAGVLASHGATWLVEQLSDGTFRVTRGQGGSVGTGVGVGWDVTATIDSVKYGTSAQAGATVSAYFNGGDVYHVSDQDAVDDLLAAHWADVAMDAALGESSRHPGRWLADRVGGWVGIPQLPVPDETYFEGGLIGDASASLTVIAGGLEAVGRSQALLGVRAGSDGTTTVYYAIAGDYDATAYFSDPDAQSAGQVLHQASIDGRLTATIEVERDSSGTVTAVTFSPAGATKQTTLRLPIANDTDAQVAADMLGRLGLVPQPGLPMPTIPRFGADDPGDSVIPGPPGFVMSGVVDFTAAVLDHGSATRQTMANHDTRHGGNLDASWVLPVGAAGGVDMIARESVDASYFDGTAWVPWEACAA